jgi:nicotinamide mononucleotide (NMN) deamidase PncC
VLEMAIGVRNALAGDFPLESIVGISVSGIAGPGGGLPEKPVGTVWIGMSAKEGSWAWKFTWPGNRIQNKEDSAQAALQLLLLYLEGSLPSEDLTGHQAIQEV